MKNHFENWLLKNYSKKIVWSILSILFISPNISLGQAAAYSQQPFGGSIPTNSVGSQFKNPTVDWYQAKIAGTDGAPNDFEWVNAGANPFAANQNIAGFPAGVGFVRYVNRTSAYPTTSGASAGDAAFLATRSLDWSGHTAYSPSNDTIGISVFRDNTAAALAVLDYIEVYLNTSPDMTGATLLSTTSGANKIYRSSTQLPAGAIGGAFNRYQFKIPNLPAFVNATGGSSNVYIIVAAYSAGGNNIYFDNLNMPQWQTPMQVTGISVVAPLNADVSKPSNDNLMLQMQVTTKGSLFPRSLDVMTFGTSGTTAYATDVAAAKLWYTGAYSSFATSNGALTVPAVMVVSPTYNFTNLIFGNTSNAAGGCPLGTTSATFNFFPGNDNYIWFAYDIAASAIPGHIVAANLEQLFTGWTTAGCFNDTILTINGIQTPASAAAFTQFPSVSAAHPIGLSYPIPIYSGGTSWQGYNNNDFISWVNSDGDNGTGIDNYYHDGTPAEILADCPGKASNAQFTRDRFACHGPDYTQFAPVVNGPAPNSIYKKRFAQMTLGRGIRNSVPGGPYTIRAQGGLNGGSSNCLAVFIDWNKDGDFNDSYSGVGGVISEKCMSTAGTNTVCLGYGDMTVPLTTFGAQQATWNVNVPTLTDVVTNVGGSGGPVVIGNVTLRVREVYANSNIDPAASSYTWGEVEDYKIQVLPDCPLLGSNVCKWVGATSNWNDANNWCPALPTKNDIAYINVGTANMPVIGDSTTAVCRTLKIMPGASLGINASKASSLVVSDDVEIGYGNTQGTNANIAVTSNYNNTITIPGKTSLPPLGLALSAHTPFRTNFNGKTQICYTATELKNTYGWKKGDIIDAIGMEVASIGPTTPFYTVTNVALTTNVATITVASTASLLTGHTVVISGCSNPLFNGTRVVTAITATTFSFALVSANVASTPATGNIVNTPVFKNFNIRAYLTTTPVVFPFPAPASTAIAVPNTTAAWSGTVVSNTLIYNNAALTLNLPMTTNGTKAGGNYFSFNLIPNSLIWDGTSNLVLSFDYSSSGAAPSRYYSLYEEAGPGFTMLILNAVGGAWNGATIDGANHYSPGIVGSGTVATLTNYRTRLDFTLHRNYNPFPITVGGDWINNNRNVRTTVYSTTPIYNIPGDSGFIAGNSRVIFDPSVRAGVNSPGLAIANPNYYQGIPGPTLVQDMDQEITSQVTTAGNSTVFSTLQINKVSATAKVVKQVSAYSPFYTGNYSDTLILTNGGFMLNRKNFTLRKPGALALTRINGWLRSEDNSGTLPGTIQSKFVWQIGTDTGVHSIPFKENSANIFSFKYNLVSGDIGNLEVATYGTPANNTPYPVAPQTVSTLTSNIPSPGVNATPWTVDRFWFAKRSTNSAISGAMTFEFDNNQDGTLSSAYVANEMKAQRYGAAGWNLPTAAQTNAIGAGALRQVGLALGTDSMLSDVFTTWTITHINNLHGPLGNDMGLKITALGSTNFCVGGSVILKANNLSGINSTPLWSNGITADSIIVTAAGNYFYTIASFNSDTVAVTVNNLPNTQITASGPTTFCNGGSVILSSNSNTGNLWSTGATTQSITVLTTGTYSVTVTNTAGCSASASINVVNQLPPTLTITPSAVILCPPTTSTAITVTGTATSYSWSPATGLNVTTGTAVIASPATTTTYTVTGTSSAGCTSTTSVKVTVKPKPVNTATINITATSAVATWDSIACAINFTVQYKPVGGSWLTVTTGSNTNSKALQGLSPSTNYVWRVKAKYPSNTFSSYTAVTNFTTPALRLGETAIENPLQVYPNPAADKITLEFPFVQSNINITITNELGQTVLSQNATTTDDVIELNIQNLNKGLYFVTVKNGENTYNSRFVKN